MKYSQLIWLVGLISLVIFLSCNLSAISVPEIDPSQGLTPTPQSTFWGVTRIGDIQAFLYPTLSAVPLEKILFAAVPCQSNISTCAVDENSQSNLYQINSDGTGLVQLMAGQGILKGAVLSPDGKRLAFLDHRKDVQNSPFLSHLYVWDFATKTIYPVMLNHGDESSEIAAQWFPDSQRLVFLGVPVNEWGTRVKEKPEQIYLSPFWNGDQGVLLELPLNLSVQTMLISPDGQSLAIVVEDLETMHSQVLMVDTDGSDFHFVMQLASSAYQSELLWSKDSRKLLVSDILGDGSSVVFVLEKTHLMGEALNGLKLPGSFWGWHALTAPGVEIAYCSASSEVIMLTLKTDSMEATTLGNAIYPSCRGGAPQWSQDGRKIAFVSTGAEPGDFWGLYVLAGNNLQERQIVKDFRVLDLLWVP